MESKRSNMMEADTPETPTVVECQSQGQEDQSAGGCNDVAMAEVDQNSRRLSDFEMELRKFPDYSLEAPVYNNDDDHEHDLIVDVDTDVIVKHLLQKFDFDSPSSTFQEVVKVTEDKLLEYLSHAVPYCYQLHPGLSSIDKVQAARNRSEVRVSKLLLPVLRGFLDKDGEFEEYLNNLSGSKSSICGHIFKLGEPTYSCRDCGVDPTCVLCFQCFQQSVHKNHRYRMHPSGGAGGFCDCGDEEAWKSAAYCDLHTPGMTHDLDVPPPNALENRVRFLIRVLLDLSYRMLNGDTSTFYAGSQRSTHKYKDLSISSHYCLVINNDETHTFDAVIKTLQKSLLCSPQMALDFATLIDREGRCFVKVDTKEDCQSTKHAIISEETRTRMMYGGIFQHLDVEVQSSFTIAFQEFALWVLQWIDGEILEKCGVFGRNTFGELVTDIKIKMKMQTNVNEPAEETMTDVTLLEAVMLTDSKLWKLARTAWHHLLTTGMLTGSYDWKKRFATFFTRHYSKIMEGFIGDDHEHHFSISSLSVQVFTVPSIAHFLIEAEDVISKIMMALKAQLTTKLNEEGKLSFARPDERQTAMLLGRCEFILADLRYILMVLPTSWSHDLFSGFNRGFKHFLWLLSVMQEMDTVKRKTGDHLEFEAEWESGCNLQMKLGPITALLLQWLGANRDIFLEAIKSCLGRLSEELQKKIGSMTFSKRRFAGHQAESLDYSVAVDPISVHFPVTRLFAGMCLHLDKFGLKLEPGSEQISLEVQPSLLFLELPLRVRVLQGQVTGGMWKRNGIAILNQLYFSSASVPSRSQVYDRDILALQLGCTLMEDSNEFLINLLKRFELFRWLDPKFYEATCVLATKEDDFRHLTSLLSEFLGTVIFMVQGRFHPQVAEISKEDCVKKDVIQLLCIRPLTHSFLQKRLAEDHDVDVEKVIEKVAELKKMRDHKGQLGMLYDLRSQFYEEFDWHHYHYSREEMSVAEVTQRGRKKACGEKEFFPPPKLPPFRERFRKVNDLLKSDVLLKVISLVFWRSNGVCQKEKKQGTAFCDAHLQKCLHLLGHGVNEVKGDEFLKQCEKWRIFVLMEDLLKLEVLEGFHDMIRWILERSARSKVTSDHDLSQAQAPSENPEDADKKQRAMKAAESRAKVMAKMAEAQKKFLASNADLIEENKNHDPDADVKITPAGDLVNPENETEAPIESLGTQDSNLSENQDNHDNETFVCILCKEENPLTLGVSVGAADEQDRSFVLATLIQRSTLLWCDNDPEAQGQARGRRRLEQIEKENLNFLETPLKRNFLVGPHVSSCGHVMHESCWKRQFDTVFLRETRRQFRFRNPLGFDVELDEWLCPMCDCLCNGVLPMTNIKMPRGGPGHSQRSEVDTDNENETRASVDPFRLWLSGMDALNRFAPKNPLNCVHLNEPGSTPTAETENCNVNTQLILDDLNGKNLPGEMFLKMFQGHDDSNGQSQGGGQDKKFKTHLIRFMQRIFDVAEDDEEASGEIPEEKMELQMSLWSSLAYTVMTSEAYHRDQGLQFFGDDVPLRWSRGLKFLTRCASMSDLEIDTGTTCALRSELWRHLRTVLGSCESEDVLDLDAFGTLVMLSNLLPFTLTAHHDNKDEEVDEVTGTVRSTTGSLSVSSLDHQILRLCFTLEVVQVLVMVIGSGSGEDLELENLLDRNELWEDVSCRTIPFLRCCAKFYENVTGVPVPSVITSKIESEFVDLVAYLDLPRNFAGIFDNPEILELSKNWIRRSLQAKGQSLSAPIIPHQLKSLVDLPLDYADLINLVSEFKCTKGGCGHTHESKTPTMCLVCGEILCSQSFTCKQELKNNNVGGCTYHAYFCGGGSGIFLRIRDCQVFCLSGHNKGCHLQAPYLDKYGEPDHGLRRGNALTLCPERFDQLRRLWISHGVPEEVARGAQNSNGFSMIEWSYY